MHCYRPFSTLPVLFLAVYTALPTQVTGSSSSEGVHIGALQTNNIPYTLIRISTIVQTLANGVTTTRTFTVKSARDSEGRIYSERHSTLPSGSDPHVDMVHYSVFDPVARTDSNWDNRTKIAYVVHVIVQSPEPDAVRQSQAVRKPRHVTREALGVRTIAGVEAGGTRSTLVVPVGEVGNDQPFTIVTEDWISTKYHIPLLTIHDDPRSGKRTDEVTDFQPGEPDPALFMIPQGYTVRERTAGQPD